MQREVAAREAAETAAATAEQQAREALAAADAAHAKEQEGSTLAAELAEARGRFVALEREHAASREELERLRSTLADAETAVEAKKAAGYFTSTDIKDEDGLRATKGRALF